MDEQTKPAKINGHQVVAKARKEIRTAKRKPAAKGVLKRKQKSVESLIDRYVKLYHYQLPKDWNKPDKKGGRPSIITEDVLRKLEYAFALDCTIEEACLMAGIYPTAYYTFLKKEKGFAKTVLLLRNIPVLIARKTVVEGLEGRREEAMSYLRVKKNREFSPRLNMTAEGKIDHDVAVDGGTTKAINKVAKAFANIAAIAQTTMQDGDEAPN